MRILNVFEEEHTFSYALPLPILQGLVGSVPHNTFHSEVRLRESEFDAVEVLLHITILREGMRQ